MALPAETLRLVQPQRRQHGIGEGRPVVVRQPLVAVRADTHLGTPGEILADRPHLQEGRPPVVAQTHAHPTHHEELRAGGLAAHLAKAQQLGQRIRAVEHPDPRAGDRLLDLATPLIDEVGRADHERARVALRMADGGQADCEHGLAATHLAIDDAGGLLAIEEQGGHGMHHFPLGRERLAGEAREHVDAIDRLHAGVDRRVLIAHRLEQPLAVLGDELGEAHGVARRRALGLDRGLDGFRRQGGSVAAGTSSMHRQSFLHGLGLPVQIHLDAGHTAGADEFGHLVDRGRAPFVEGEAGHEAEGDALGPVVLGDPPGGGTEGIEELGDDHRILGFVGFGCRVLFEPGDQGLMQRIRDLGVHGVSPIKDGRDASPAGERPARGVE